MPESGWETPARNIIWATFAVLIFYLVRIDRLLRRTPDEVKKLSGPRWTPEQLKERYDTLKERPMNYKHKLPPKLDRRYIVTGGSGEFVSAESAKPRDRANR